MKIGVTSGNLDKISAVEDAYCDLGIDVDVMGYIVASGVDEQPVEEDVLQGARNRLEAVKAYDQNLDQIVSIESGIFKEGDAWVDRAVVVLYDVRADSELSALSDPVLFETCYVEEAKKQGFNRFMVGKIMEDAGHVKDANDPHSSISGKPRREYLRDTLKGLLLMSD